MVTRILPPLASSRFEVVGVSWERVLLRIDVRVPPRVRACEGASRAPDDEVDVDPVVEAAPAAFILRRERDGRHPVEAHRLDPDTWRLTINVTNFEERKPVPDATWRIAAFDGKGWHRVGCDFALLGSLDDASRPFLHDANRRAYVVEPGIGAVEPEFVLRVFSFARPPAASALRTRAGLFAARAWSAVKRSCLIAAYRASLALHPDRGGTILFASEARPGLQGNLRTIRDRMVERGLDERFDFLYSFRTEAMSDRKSALRLAWLMGSAGTIIVDDYFVLLDSFPVDGNHTIIQAWHAGSGFKDVGYSRFGKWGSPNLTNAHRHYTYAICGSEPLRDVYSEVFGIERGAVIPTGLPRIDDFLDPARIADAKALFARSYPEAAGKRVLLLAPTFRGRGMADGYYDWDRVDFDALYEALGEDSVLLVRQHHFVVDPAPIPGALRDRIIDASGFPDTNDLLHCADVLITDYSSIIYEYSLLERPMIFYAYDLDMYAATRGMHRDYRATAPGPVATSFDRLLALIADPGLDAAKALAFREENFDHADRGNADRFIDWLILGGMPQRFRSATPGEEE